MRVKIVTVGKASDKHVTSLVQEFEKRLSRWTTVEWQLLPNGRSVADESAAILKLLRTDEFVILLDERGVELKTAAMTNELDNWLQRSTPLTFVIGGAFGVDDSVVKRADFVWSFSKLVFPHQLMRLLLVEQLYRMFNFRSGGKYHH